MSKKSVSGINKPFLFFLVVVVLLIGGFFYFASQGGSADVAGISTENGDTQTIEINVKGGYTPSNIQAKAGMETILKFKTNNTYDCSASISIPSLGVREFLSPKGEREYTVSAEQAKGKLTGSCSMGHYRFTINFV